MIDLDERVVDDGELDPESPFAVDDTGELVADPLFSCRCPHCQHILETEAYGPEACPWCHRIVELLPPPMPSPYQSAFATDIYEEFEEEYYREYSCPACFNSHSDDDGGEFMLLRRGWVRCQCCGWSFFRPQLWDELRAVLREDCMGPPIGQYIRAGGSFLGKALQQPEECLHLLLEPGDHVLPSDMRDLFPDRQLLIESAAPGVEVRLLGNCRRFGGRLRLRGVSLAGSLELEDNRATFERCRFEGTTGGPAIRAGGPHACLRMRHCHVAHSAGAGIEADNGATVRLTDCVLHHNQAQGILVRRGSWLRLRRSDIRDNGGDGIRIQSVGSAFLHDCQLTENGGIGLDVQRGRAVVRRSNITGQRGPGVRLGRGGRLVMLRCHTRNGGSDGLRASVRARVLIAECTFSGNAATGLKLGPKSRVTLRCAEIAANGVGVHLTASTRLYASATQVSRNTSRDWDVRPGGQIIVVS